LRNKIIIDAIAVDNIQLYLHNILLLQVQIARNFYLGIDTDVPLYVIRNFRLFQHDFFEEQSTRKISYIFKKITNKKKKIEKNKKSLKLISK